MDLFDFFSEEITEECPRISINMESGETTHGFIRTPKLDRLRGFLKGNMRRYK